MWTMGAGAGAAAHPQPMAGGLATAGAASWKFPGSPLQGALAPIAPQWGKAAHTGALLAPCTMHFPVGRVFPRTGGCSPQWPTLDCWGAAGCRLGRFLEVSGKPPAKRLWARLHHNGAGQPKSEGTFPWVVFAPGLIDAVRNSPFSSFGVRPAVGQPGLLIGAFVGASRKLPRNFRGRQPPAHERFKMGL